MLSIFTNHTELRPEVKIYPSSKSTIKIVVVVLVVLFLLFILLVIICCCWRRRRRNRDRRANQHSSWCGANCCICFRGGDNKNDTDGMLEQENTDINISNHNENHELNKRPLLTKNIYGEAYGPNRDVECSYYDPKTTATGKAPSGKAPVQDSTNELYESATDDAKKPLLTTDTTPAAKSSSSNKNTPVTSIKPGKRYQDVHSRKAVNLPSINVGDSPPLGNDDDDDSEDYESVESPIYKTPSNASANIYKTPSNASADIYKTPSNASANIYKTPSNASSMEPIYKTPSNTSDSTTNPSVRTLSSTSSHPETPLYKTPSNSSTKPSSIYKTPSNVSASQAPTFSSREAKADGYQGSKMNPKKKEKKYQDVNSRSPAGGDDTSNHQHSSNKDTGNSLDGLPPSLQVNSNNTFTDAGETGDASIYTNVNDDKEDQHIYKTPSNVHRDTMVENDDHDYETPPSAPGYDNNNQIYQNVKELK